MDDRIKQYDSLIKAFEDHYPRLIYHYTSAGGFRGIIESSEVWLTNAAFLNDITECLALQSETNLFNHEELTNQYVKCRWDRFRKYANTLDKEKDTFIASFSKKRDSLYQYRAYGNYCIGFDAKKLITSPGFYFYECVYHSSKIRAWLLKREKVEEWNGDNLIDEWKSAAAHRLIYDASRKFKHRAFEGEKEARIISVSHHKWDYPNSPSMYTKDPPIHYRDHPKLSCPIPYVKLFTADSNKRAYKLSITSKETCWQMKERKRKEEASTARGLLPIRDVWIGPMIHQVDATIACEILLKDRGYGNVAVNASEIPYRGF